MTRPTARTAKFTATIWPAGEVDEYGGESYGTPYTVLCNYMEGGNRTATSSDGTTFQPVLTVWYELTDDQPRPDESETCYVAIGDQTAYSNPSTAGGKIIKSNALQPWRDSTQNPDVELSC